MEEVTAFGFKRINRENWTRPDPAGILLGQVTIDGFRGDEDAADYLEHLLSFELSEKVPDEIRKIFEVSRSTMSYGYFYYPIFTIASEQLFRIHELAAEKIAHLAFGKKPKGSSFAKNIDQLAAAGFIGATEREGWQAARTLRNLSSHPKRQSIMTPGDAANILRSTTVRINKLFEAYDASGAPEAS